MIFAAKFLHSVVYQLVWRLLIIEMSDKLSMSVYIIQLFK